MRVLFLSPRQAWPPNSGAKLRDYHLARALGDRADVTYVYFADASEQQTQKDAFSFCREVIAVPAPKKYTPAKVLRGLLGTPLPVVNYTSGQMAQIVSEQLATKQTDVVHLDSMHLAECVPLVKKRSPATRIMLDWHNIESEAMFRYAATAGSRVRRAYAGMTARGLQRVENSLLHTCFAHVVCSEREKRELERRNPDARVAVIENGVDTDYFQPASGMPASNRIVFVGQMSYHANADGIIWFVRQIWPAVRARFPQMTLSIVGSNPGPAVYALKDEAGIEVTGTVPDVRPYYRDAFAAIVPLLTGGGTRLKILEAMAAGAPVVSTELGAEGLAVANGREVLIAGDSATSWIEAFSACSDAGRRSAITASARDLVCSQYDWNSIGRRLAAAYDHWSNE